MLNDVSYLASNSSCFLHGKDKEWSENSKIYYIRWYLLVSIVTRKSEKNLKISHVSIKCQLELLKTVLLLNWMTRVIEHFSSSSM